MNRFIHNNWGKVLVNISLTIPNILLDEFSRSGAHQLLDLPSLVSACPFYFHQNFRPTNMAFSRHQKSEIVGQDARPAVRKTVNGKTI
jgi:hypothetical protein